MFRSHLLYFKISAEIPRLLWGSKSNRSAFWHVTSLVFRRHLIFPPSKWRLDEPPAGEILKPDIINFQTPSCFFFKMASERTPLLAGPDYSHPMENLDIDRLFEERLGEFGRCACITLLILKSWVFWVAIWSRASFLGRIQNILTASDHNKIHHKCWHDFNFVL